MYDQLINIYEKNEEWKCFIKHVHSTIFTFLTWYTCYLPFKLFALLAPKKLNYLASNILAFWAYPMNFMKVIPETCYAH
jgi:hypothetical protein